MANYETFDATNVDSIRYFANQLSRCKSNEVGDDFILNNLKKTLDAIQSTEKFYYENENARELFRLLSTLSTFCESGMVADEIIKLNMYQIFTKIVECQIAKEEMNCYILRSLFNILNSLTLFSSKIAKQNAESGFCRLTTELLNRLNYNISNTINNEDLLRLYDRLIIFLMNNSFYRDIKEPLDNIGMVPFLSAIFNKLNTVKDTKNEIKYVMLNVTRALAHLLNDAELNTTPLLVDIVDQLVNALNACITNSKTNTHVIRNTKYYTQYSIGYSNFRHYILSYLKCLRLIAVNDMVKQRLYEKDIINSLEEVFVDGNQDEIKKSVNLLCLLCFNANTIGYIRRCESLQQTIVNIKNETDDRILKSYCNQIIIMLTYNEQLKQELEQRKNKEKRHIFISFSHKCKNECSIINDELIRRGYKTWIHLNEEFEDLHMVVADAIENASVVLVCYSYEYKTSNHCRLELQYAVDLDKDIVAVQLDVKYKPDGWLSMLLETKLHVDIMKLIDSFDSLCKQLDDLLNKQAEDMKKQTKSQVSLRNNSTNLKKENEDDNEMDKCETSNESIDEILAKLNESKEQKSRTKSNIASSSVRYTTLSCLKHVRCIAVNDTVKQTLYEKGIVPILQNILVNGNERVRNRCMDLLCLLCFNQNVVACIEQSEPLKEIINYIKNTTKDNTMKGSCSLIERMLTYNERIEKVLLEQKTKPKGEQQHIMISYNRRHDKDECLKINAELCKRGYKTWLIDVNAVGDDSQDPTSKAIENALVVLVCYSDKYKMGIQCRFELDYASKLNKHIVAVKLEKSYDADEWLGMMLASKIQVNFSKDTDFVASLESLCKQIDALLGEPESGIKQGVEINEPDKPISVIPNENSSSNPINWKKDDVQKWFMEKELDSLAKVFQKYNGIALNSLWEMKSKDYTQFINFIETEIEKSKTNVDPMEKLCFYRLIDQLFGR